MAVLNLVLLQTEDWVRTFFNLAVGCCELLIITTCSDLQVFGNVVWFQSIYFTRTEVFPVRCFRTKQCTLYLFADQPYDSEGHFAWSAWWIEFTSHLKNLTFF